MNPYNLTMRLFSYLLLLVVGLIGCVTAPSTSTISQGSNAGATALSAQPPSKIALLVPLQGGTGQSGEAIRNGFLAAYYYDKEQQANAPTVEVMDTSGGNVTALYQQAVSQGANFVVGPLTKKDVEVLAASGNLTVPVLALNTLDGGKSARNLYQFGLSPQEEAEQVAARARQEGYARVLILAPDDAWGQGIAQAFQRRWQSLGGSVTENFAYNKANLPAQIQSALRAGEAPMQGSERRSLPQSRQDMDVIFLVAFPQQARQIKPLLAYYNAGNIPVYATSLVYTGTPSPNNDKDLDGIQFGDMPWLIGAQSSEWSEIREHAKTLWPASFQRSPRLYAMGIDAYTLTSRLSTLSQSSSIQGATGELSMDSQQIRRQLEWARIQNGYPQALN